MPVSFLHDQNSVPSLLTERDELIKVVWCVRERQKKMLDSRITERYKQNCKPIKCEDIYKVKNSRKTYKRKNRNLNMSMTRAFVND